MIDYDSRKWLSHVFSLEGSIAPKIFWRVLIHVAWAVAVVIIHRRVIAIEVPPTVHTLIGVALGLLLVFRTNASYDRFWEGRKAWGQIVNDTRNVVRASRELLGATPAVLEQIALWTAAFPYACMNSLRGGSGLSPSSSRLPAALVAETLAARHVPLAVAARISRLLAEGRGTSVFAERAAIVIDGGAVRSLIDAIGVCERIQRTPLPFAYVVHLRRALLLYLITLPFALVGQYEWSAVIYTFLIVYILLGIEEIGVEIENPFGTDHNDLPLERICAGIEADVLDLVASHKPAAPAAPAAVTAPLMTVLEPQPASG